MPNKIIRRKLLASSIAMIVASTAHAQNSSDTVMEEEVIVTGIRASLKKSTDLKREATGVVDVISAEDIGKFPDTNLAESLQRVTGVSIDRVDGEGSRVTVRGINPDFNLVTLNGRTIARTTGARSFDFSNLASEMVSGVEVRKTSDASHFSGGMGSTIDLKTNKPLSNPGLKMIGSIKAVDDKSTTDGSVTPEIAGLYSQTFADDTFGVSVGISYQERDNGKNEGIVGTGWRSFEAANDAGQWGAVPQDNQVNRPSGTDVYSVPQTTIYRFTEQQRERLNGQLVLQWMPAENVTATFDYNRFERNVATQSNEVSAWFTFAPSQSVWTDGPVSSPLIYSETYLDGSGAPDPQDLSMAARDSAEKFETDAFGLNIDWQVNDRLSLAFDIALSEAERSPDSPYGSSNTLSTAAYIRTSATTDFTGDLPALIVGGGNAVQPSDMRLTGSVFGNSRDSSEIDQYQFDGKFELNDASSIDFGVEFTEVTNQSQEVNVQRDAWGGVGAAGDFDDSLFPARSVQSRFDAGLGDFSETLAGGNTLADGTVLSVNNVQDVYFDFDFGSVRDRAEQLYTNEGYPVGDCGTSFCPSTDYGRDVDRTTTEETTSLYVQYNFEGDLGVPFDVHAGLRYEETDVDSQALAAIYDGAVWVADTEIPLVATGDRSFLEQSGSYDHLLPNLSVNVDLTDDMKLRFAASKTVGRAGYADLQGGTVLGTVANRAGGSGSSGNPSLEPLESTNFDISWEWYYGESSYASVGYFKKDIKNFISSVDVERTSDEIFGTGNVITNPSSGPKVDEAIAVGGSTDGGEIRDYIFANFPTDPSVDVAEQRISGDANDDPLIFDISIPSNGEGENGVDGFEIAVQHMLGDTGFGGIVNMTIVDTDLEYDNFILSDQEALIGVSDSANIVLFYDKDGLNARLAWNWRDEFLSDRGQDTGAHPKYTEAYEQIDLNVSYEVMDGLEVFVEGINITDEHQRVHGRDDRQVLRLTETGARWQFGARYAF